MSKWTHAICGACWEKREPGTLPVRLREPDLEVCCFCSNQTKSGIYVRENPNVPRCQGFHEENLADYFERQSQPEPQDATEALLEAAKLSLDQMVKMGWAISFNSRLKDCYYKTKSAVQQAERAKRAVPVPKQGT